MPSENPARNNPTQDLWNRLADSTDIIFGAREAIIALRKLRTETDEALEHPFDIMEYADCLMCLLDAARLAGFTLPQLCAAAQMKWSECKTRNWKQQQDGTFQHE